MLPLADAISWGWVVEGAKKKLQQAIMAWLQPCHGFFLKDFNQHLKKEIHTFQSYLVMLWSPL